ncbi:MAG: hypothetical protein JSS56_03325 [Proteobacteria bacterium]|nr:hypothetical protein [Pseudomonadota bacterium]
MQALRLTTGLLLVGAAFQTSALTIGRPVGSAWIGKPLDLVIPLELDRSESGDSQCIEADVLQGDTRLDDRRVTISLEPGPNPDAPRVRLRTTRAVEEPVVTVKLTAGCVAKSTRQYVLLADLPEAPPVMASPSRLAPPAVAAGEREGSSAASLPRTSRAARSAQGSSGAQAQAGGTGGDVAQAPPQPRRRVAAVTAPAPAAEPVRKPRPPAAKPAPSAPAPATEPKSRLQIDALAPEPATQAPRPALAPSNGAANAAPASAQPAVAPTATATPAGAAPAAESGAASPVAGAEASGSTAAAAALAAAAEQGRRDADRLKEMEAALATLREQSAQNQRHLLELRGSLAQAEADRYRNPVIYVLLGLLALALVALLALWRQARSARQAAWWGGAAEEDAASAAAVAAKQPLPRHGELADDEDDEDGVDTESNPTATADVSGLRSAAQGLRVTALPAGVGASAFQGVPARAVSAEQLFDVQQQSEFFLSLGQHDQAIGVLREHISVSPGTSAMAYLDLLSLLKELDRRADYAAVVREFGHAFNVAVPDFDQFTGGDRGLEHYPEVLLHIVEKWPSQGTADLIEAFVFRKPSSPEDVFDLPAYQDLLMLYAVARDLSEYTGPWDAPSELPQAPPVMPPVAVPPGQSERAYQQTAPMPYLPSEAVDEGDAAPARQEFAVPSLEMDLSDLDRTAFETLRAPIEPAQPASKPSAVPSVDPHLIDFDPFDSDPGQGELRPRHLGVKR